MKTAIGLAMGFAAFLTIVAIGAFAKAYGGDMSAFTILFVPLILIIAFVAWIGITSDLEKEDKQIAENREREAERVRLYQRIEQLEAREPHYITYQVQVPRRLSHERTRR